MKSSKIITARGIVFLTSLLASTLSVFAQSLPRHANGKIAFVDIDNASPYYQDDGHVGISVMNPDGSGRTTLTLSQNRCPQLNRPAGICGPDQFDTTPVWSPDGTQISFIRGVPTPHFSNESDVFLMNADGSNQRRLTQLGNVSWSRPTWSADGTKLAFVGPGGVYVINSDGSNQHSIGSGDQPAWSPNGSKLVFKADDGLYVMNPDGSGRVRITAPKNPSPYLYDYDSEPAWSPDGAKILFNRWTGCDFDDNCQSITIWTVNANGTNPAQLSNIIAYGGPVWSPDGTKIVFEWLGNDDRYGDLFTMDSNGSNLTRLTDTPNGFEGAPSWQPLAPAGCAYFNPIDCADFFVRQQYVDFLGREPESSCPPNQCGLDFYLPILNGCGDNVECMKYTRGALSANFFRSPEFQAKGVYVMNLYLLTVGQRPTTEAELQDATKVERPHYAEFIADMAAISSPDDRNGSDSAKKAALTQAFVQRAEIVAKYPTSTYPTLISFGNALAATGGVSLSAATQNAIAAATTRAQVLQVIAESAEVNTKFYQPTFVTMEYFGYLRRDPGDCHDPANWWGEPNARDCGFVYHNRRFNELLPQLGSDLTQNFIVRGFIESPEYRGRFGLP